jgi:hypothetical protein
MEALLLPILIIATIVYFGLLRPVESGARMLDKEVRLLEDEQTQRHDLWYNDNHINPELEAKASLSRSYYDSRRKVK